MEYRLQVYSGSSDFPLNLGYLCTLAILLIKVCERAKIFGDIYYCFCYLKWYNTDIIQKTSGDETDEKKYRFITLLLSLLLRQFCLLPMIGHADL